MKDYEISYKLSSIMDGLEGAAVKFNNGDEQVHLSLPASRIMALELYGIKDSHKILYNVFDKNGLKCIVDDEEITKPLIIMLSFDLNDYDKLVTSFYDFCKEIASTSEHIVIKLEDENRVVIGTPILSIFRDVEKEKSKEFGLLMNLMSEAVSDTFGDESVESVGITVEEDKLFHIGKYFLTIDFFDRDEILTELSDIEKISKMVIDCSLRALDIIFEDYL